MNLILILFHIFAIVAATLLFLRLGKEALIAWSAFLIVIANLFVHKQITLFGLDITCSDAIAVGYLLTTNLIQEFFGKTLAKKSITIALVISSAFMLFSWVQLLYRPSVHDTTHLHFSIILAPVTRITIASMISFFIVQYLDLTFFNFLKKKTASKLLTLRLFLSSFFSHALDTLLFSFLALYGTVESIGAIIAFSLVVKMAVVVFATPFMALSRRVYSV